MTIRAKIRASSIAAIVLVIVFIGVMVVLGSSLRTSYEKQQFSQKITETSFQLSLLQSEYVLHPSERPKTQWINAHEVLSRVLDETAPLFLKTEEQALFEDTRKVSVDSLALFGQIIQNIEQGGNETVREELANQLTVKSQERVSNVLRLSELSRKDADNALRFFEIILIMLGVLFAMIYIASYFITTAIVASLRALGEDVTRISELDFSSSTTTTIITTTRKDELGMLSRAFNTMVVKLKESYTILEQKVVERTTKLAEKTREAENSQAAALNVLEDLNIEKSKVEIVKVRDEAMLASIGDGLVAVDKEKRILLVNKGFEDILGWKDNEIVGKKFTEIFPLLRENGETIEEAERPITKALRGTTTTTTTTTYSKRKDGSMFPVAINAASIISEKEIIGAIVVFRDITKEKELDRAKSEFISIASHQLRTPVSGLSWITEALQFTSSNLDPKQKTYIKDLSMLSKRLVTLVEDLLNLSRIELKTAIVTEKDSVDIAVFTEEFIKETESYARSKKHTIILNKNITSPVVMEINKKSLYNTRRVFPRGLPR